MRASFTELPLLLEAGEAQIRGVDWGEMRVAVLSVPAGTDMGPLLAGLPNDRCPGDHWGYVVSGRLRIEHANGEEELIGAGDFYYIPRGHTGIAEEATQFLEIGEPGPHQQFLDNATRNLAAMAATSL